MKKITAFLITVIFCLGCLPPALGAESMSREDIFKLIEESGDYEKTVRWGDYLMALCKDGKTLKYTYLGNVWVEINLDVFEESDIVINDDTVFNINDIAVYGDQVFAACDNGIVIIITSCAKCYKVKQVCDFNIEKINLGTDGFEFFGADINEKEVVSYNSLRQEKIDPEIALGLAVNGAVLVDVRDKEDFETGHVYGAVNIPIDQIEDISRYSKNSTIIFYCYSGNRAGRAVEEAQKMGFVNVYNAGGYEDFN